ncbi:MAG: HD domain-containing protein [Clostridia bacterium]|nr:HD domain-containing protein [Clostridia bacterium]
MTGAEKYRLFASLSQVSRTGWVQRGVQNPESVAEHIYGCWLLGTFLLPEQDKHPDYDKQDILAMLLLHDLPEAITGDIPRPVKKQNPDYYDRLEREAAERSLLSGECTPQQRTLWQQWDTQSTYNALVAKDIDNLQAIYTFCCLQKNDPSLFTDEDTAAWLQGLQQLKTPTVQKIAKELMKERESDV